MRADFKSPEWRQKHKYKWLKEMARLVPDSKPDVDAVMKQKRKCWALFMLYLPLTILWFPFALTRLILYHLVKFIDRLDGFLWELLRPKIDAFSELSKLINKAEHGDYKTRLHVLKQDFGWNFESYHYVNKEQSQ